MGEKPQGCILCQKWQESNDRENLVLYRGKLTYVLMNLFPYNPGHLMVAPYEHKSQLDDLSEATLAELMSLTTVSTKVLGRVMAPHGYNIGMNLGSVAGAGIADHLHMHIVPRYMGDTNFMPTLAHTKVLPEALLTTYDKLKQTFEELTPD